ncbi:MAG: hypothetical protein KAU62_13975 [Candidatus Heimdallarchaeota archaeon]|nr:hypothetical protein [Candidatus Heimdallarchaeota archaeon]MCK4612259.1 hypothetical protein [Candidatus Heimdallarchaeota archaeon]
MSKKLEANVVGAKGEEFVKDYLENTLGLSVVSLRGKNISCDFLVVGAIGDTTTIEVKTTQCKQFAIPDMHSNQILTGEMGEPRSLYADELWIVNNILDKPIIHIITRAKFEQMIIEHPEAVSSVKRWRTNDNITKDYAEKLLWEKPK